MRCIINHLWKDRTWVQRFLLILLCAIIVMIWPVCLVREEYTNRSGDEAFEETPPLQQGMTYTQKFYAEKNQLKSIGYVLAFDPEAPLKGAFWVELLDWEGNVVYSSEYPYNLTPDYRYCDITIDLPMKKGGQYELRLTNLTVTENVPRVMYTADSAMYATNHCGMTFDGAVVAGESLVRYIWSVPLSWDQILMYWGIAGFVVFVLWELEEVRVAHKKDRE